MAPKLPPLFPGYDLGRVLQQGLDDLQSSGQVLLGAVLLVTGLLLLIKDTELGGPISRGVGQRVGGRVRKGVRKVPIAGRLA